ncbi:MAG TPA: hydrolase 1, exosortase A system-associated [Novosphingobium sp.]|nr:hydrolase 1, exosortase A system-associated [Novosphingobium sp.]
MTRRHLGFACEGAMLAATLDAAPGTTGLVIVSGGNEVRSGAWAGQALLAAEIAAAGFPVLRFDRRGVGDSDGPNGGFRTSGPDIAAALCAFREVSPNLTRIVAFGNCDAASALMLGGGTGCDALTLSNPWTIESDDGDQAPPPEVVRAHYRQRLSDPRALIRLLTGKVSPGKLIASLRDAMGPPPPPSSLAQDMAAGLERFAGPVTILLAERDRTAQAFLAAWDKQDARLRTCPGASHSYVEATARDWLREQLLTVLRD